MGWDNIGKLDVPRFFVCSAFQNEFPEVGDLVGSRACLCAFMPQGMVPHFRWIM